MDIKEVLEKHASWLNNSEGGERADLRGANLNGLIGNLAEIKSLFIDTYPVTYTAEVIQIGREMHKISEWKGFCDARISSMGNGALEWWNKYKDFIMQAIALSPARPTTG